MKTFNTFLAEASKAPPKIGKHNDYKLLSAGDEVVMTYEKENYQQHKFLGFTATGNEDRPEFKNLVSLFRAKNVTKLKDLEAIDKKNKKDSDIKAVFGFKGTTISAYLYKGIWSVGSGAAPFNIDSFV